MKCTERFRSLSVGFLLFLFCTIYAQRFMNNMEFYVGSSANTSARDSYRDLTCHFNSSEPTYDSDGGIPQNLIINVVLWMIMVVGFCIIRRVAWDYGRIALVQKDNTSNWTSVFYGGKTNQPETSSKDDISSSATDINEDSLDKGYLTWIPALFRMSDDLIRAKSGVDAVEYLNFQKHMIVYTAVICALSLGVILPVNYSGDNETPGTTFGATTVSNLRPRDPVFWLHLFFAVLYLVLLFFFIRHFSLQLQKTVNVDESAYTVMLTRVPKTVTADEIKKHFQEVYGELQVQEVQLAYGINKLVSLDRRHEAAKLGRQHCEEILQKSGERPQESISSSTLSPCCPCFARRQVDGVDYFTAEERRMAADCQEELNNVLSSSLGIAFVTFSSERMVQRCLEDYNLIKHSSPLSSLSNEISSERWQVSHAPTPGNIIWEHLSVKPESWWLRNLTLNLILFIFVLFITTPTVLLTLTDDIKDKTLNIEYANHPFYSQFLPTVLLWTFSALLPTIVTWSSYYEAHWTRSKLEHSVMIKTYVFLMFMVVILPALELTSADAFFELTFKGDIGGIESRLSCVFLPNNGAFFVNYVITATFIGTALELLRFPELFWYTTRLVFSKHVGEKALAKKESVREFPFGTMYAWMMVVSTVVILYSITCPLVVPFGLLYLVLKHIVDRYNLVFNYRSPAYSYIDTSVHETAVLFAAISSYLLLFSILFYSFLRVGITNAQTVFALIVFVILMILFVGRVCFGMFKRSSPLRRYHSRPIEEDGNDAVVPEAYLPPVLQSKSRTNLYNDKDSPQLTHRHTYGSAGFPVVNDHVIDTASLNPQPNDDVALNIHDDKS